MLSCICLTTVLLVMHTGYLTQIKATHTEMLLQRVLTFSSSLEETKTHNKVLLPFPRSRMPGPFLVMPKSFQVENG